jgi:hypothetical protein
LRTFYFWGALNCPVLLLIVGFGWRSINGWLADTPDYPALHANRPVNYSRESAISQDYSVVALDHLVLCRTA